MNVKGRNRYVIRKVIRQVFSKDGSRKIQESGACGPVAILKGQNLNGYVNRYVIRNVIKLVFTQDGSLEIQKSGAHGPLAILKGRNLNRYVNRYLNR